jgi:membrane protein insertase Oxa1/YidC/SpoIIIJ
MLIFGADIPLIEVIFALSIIIFIILLETIILVTLMLRQMQKTRQLASLIEKLSETILSIKKGEIEELDKLRKRKR